tara:strand:- start:306 stop:695 length:390 start_codon:yes stop_codon:yes gene_type:complete
MNTGNEGLKKLFKIVLGTEVNIKDNIDVTEELVFIGLINRLEESEKMEHTVFQTSGIDLSKVTDGLWFVIENQMRMLYGPEASELIQWYIYDRFNPDGSIVPLEGPHEKLFILKEPKDLWSYIKYKSIK